MIKLPKSFSDFKKHFGSIFSYNKKNLILGIILGLFLCFFSFQYAEAIWWWEYPGMILNYILTMPIRIPYLILVITIGVIGFACSVVFTLVATLLSWLIEASLSIQVVPGPEAFDVINVGFEFTKNFANMFIILILAIIGLATILKIREYEAKKLLPKLLMVALLINFTPVIVGFIVDIANLFTNFFFTEIIKSGAFTSINLDAVFNIMNEIGTVMNIELNILDPNVVINTLIPIIVKGVLMIVFYNIATIVYLLVFLLFFFRFVMLWILVILAPIAFFSQILPKGPTVKALFPNILHWDKWWETLIQWAFIGVPLGFFLYLAAFIISTTDGGIPTTIIDTDSFISVFSNIMEAILGPMVAIIILIMGIMISVESMPAAAKRIYGGVKKFGKIAGKTIATRGVGTVGKRLKRVAITQGRVEKKWQDVKGLKGWAGRRYAGARKAVVARPVRWAYRAAGTTPEMAASKNVDGLTKNFEKEFGAKGERIDQAIKVHGGKLGFKALSSEKKAAFALYLAKTKGQEGFNKLDVGQQRKAIKAINTHDPNKIVDVVKHNPNLVNDKEVGTLIANKMVKDTEKDKEYQRLRGEGKTHEKALKESAFIKAATSIRASDIKDHDKSTLIGDDNEKLRKIWLERFGPEYWNQIAMNFDQEVMDSFSETAVGMGGAKTLAKKNPGTLKYFAAHGQDRWGWKPLEGATSKKEASEFVEGVREKEAKKPPTPPVIPSYLHIDDKRIGGRAQKIHDERGGTPPGTDEPRRLYLEKQDWAKATGQLIKEEKELLKKPVSREIIEEIGLQRRNIRDKRKIQGMVKQINKEIDTAKEKIKEIKSLQDKPAISPAAQQRIATEIKRGADELSKTEENLKNLKRRLKEEKVTMQAQIISNQNT